MKTQMVLLSELITDKCPGRESQTTTESQVVKLVYVLEDGTKFTEPVTITLDKVVTKGHHRVEAYRRFIASKYGVGTPEYENFMIEVVVLQVKYLTATAEERGSILCDAFKDNARHEGQPLTAKALAVHVSRLHGLRWTLREITAEMCPPFTPPQIQRAWKLAQGTAKNRAIKHARDAFSGGRLTWPDAVEQANDTFGTSIDFAKVSPDETGGQKDRLYLLRDSATSLLASWGRQFNSALEGLDAGTKPQAALSNVIERVSEDVQRFIRKAESLTASCNERLSKEKRITRKTVQY